MFIGHVRITRYVLASVLAILVVIGAVESLTPTLAPYLAAPPASASPSIIGLLFTLQIVGYTLAALVSGLLAARIGNGLLERMTSSLNE